MVRHALERLTIQVKDDTDAAVAEITAQVKNNTVQHIEIKAKLLK
jgi:hypothetical protein